MMFSASLLILVLYFLELGTDPMPLSIAIVFVSFSFVILLLFYKLSVSIDAKNLIISFGVGIICKKILLSDIASVKKTKTKCYNGWGIRFIKKGKLYNIQGFNAVELTFKNKPRRVLIGTKLNSNLERELKKRIS